MSNYTENSDRTKNFEKLTEEYLDKKGLNEAQKNAVKSSPQYKAYAFGLSPELAIKFNNPFQVLALTELKLSPEQALLVNSPVSFNDIKENNLTYSQISTILSQEQFSGNVNVSERLKFAEENNLDADLVLLLQYPAQFKAISEMNITIDEALKFGNGEERANELMHRKGDLNNFLDAVISTSPGLKVFPHQFQLPISENNIRSVVEFEIFKQHQIPGLKFDYISAQETCKNLKTMEHIRMADFSTLDDFNKAIVDFSDQYSQIARVKNSLLLLMNEYNKEIGIQPNITTFKDLCDTKDNNQTFKDNLLGLQDTLKLHNLDFNSTQINSFCEINGSELILI